MSMSMSMSMNPSMNQKSLEPEEVEVPSEWQIAYTAGDRARALNESDVISAIEFDRSGDYCAVGNKGGRVTIYCRDGAQRADRLLFHPRIPQYTPYAEFQSHHPEFDYLKSLEIEEKINQIKWCRPSNNAQYLLSTNDKTVKLWKIHERNVWNVTQYNERAMQAGIMAKSGSGKLGSMRAIQLPHYSLRDHVTATTAKRTYANAHTYHINSIALNSDGETFLSADDLRINLWSLAISDQSFNIVDIKPPNMEDLMEVITAADFHPSHCNVMMYSTSRGAIKLGDLRQAALCDTYSQIYEEPEDPEERNFFSEIIASISDIKFSPDGRYILARDFMTLKVWDINMNSRPVQTIRIHEHLVPRLGNLYESDCIFDKFECAVSGDGNSFVTGSYNGECHIYDRYGRSDVCLTPSPRIVPTARRHSLPHNAVPSSMVAPAMDTMNTEGLPAPPAQNMEVPDFTHKVLQASWHPTLNEVAVAIRNNLYIYTRIDDDAYSTKSGQAPNQVSASMPASMPPVPMMDKLMEMSEAPAAPNVN